MGSLEIRPVHSTGDLRRFIRLPFGLYRHEPNWVAPLIFERKQFLDRRKNPFFEHGRAEYFLALRDGKPVGRITAQVDDNAQRFQDNKWGWFGFFEFVFFLVILLVAYIYIWRKGALEWR